MYNKMSDTNYAITIKNILSNHQSTEQELSDLFVAIVNRHKGIYVDHVYERDSRGILHLHGHFMARKGIRKNLYKRYGYHIHIDCLKSIDDLKNWVTYMYKDERSDWFKRLYNGDYLFIEKEDNT